MKFALVGLTLTLCCAVTGASALPAATSSSVTPTANALPVMKTVVVVKKVVRRPVVRRPLVRRPVVKKVIVR